MIDEIKDMIRNKRTYEAELEYLVGCLNDTELENQIVIGERIAYLRQKLSIISSWMKVLTEDGAFVTQRHLIDGIDIPRIVAEYEAKWGREFAKSERTSKTYQQRAIKHIVEFEQRKLQNNINVYQDHRYDS